MNFPHIELDNVIIKVIGIGNTAGYVVNNMQTSSVKDVDFFSIDATQPINQKIDGTHLLFQVADTSDPESMENCLSIAKRARDQNILTVAIITTGFSTDKLTELGKYTDSLIIISEKTRSQENALILDIVRGISDLITQQGLIGFDLADAKSVLGDAGRSIVGVGTAAGVNRAQEATEKALHCFNSIDLRFTNGLLVNISGTDMEIVEIDKILSSIHNLVSKNSIIKVGTTLDRKLVDTIKVTIIATGLSVDGY